MKKQKNVGASIARPLRRTQRGITLIALVITIIVLLILAGITINLTLGQDGIITKAQEAGKTYQNAESEEQVKLGDLEASITAGKVARTENEIQYVGDGMGNIIPVPVGFSYLEGNKNTGFVIKNDIDNNEYVWIPVDDTTPYSYDRYAFTRDDWSYSQTKGEYDSATQSDKIVRGDYYFTEAMQSIDATRTELDSVNAYKGFYIGRYEVGVIGYTSISKTADGTESWTGYSNGTAVVQQGKQVWNYITRDKAKEVAESMYSDNNAVISRLCSSYAWDTALKFIEKNYPEYPTNSTVGNYKDVASILGKPALTGKTQAVNNIYDLGGNVWECTTEVCSDENYPYTLRGGNYSYSYASTYPAAHRDRGGTTGAYDDVGFRTTLYL